MGETGPCGRCSEIYYFRGDEIPCAEPVCRGVECSCDRYVEIWNNVFMEFDRDAERHARRRCRRRRSTRAWVSSASLGASRASSRTTTRICSRRSSTRSARSPAGDTPVHAGPVDHPDVSMRVIADHLRAMTFLIADGVMPSNEWRGYVLRKIMRRAMRHGKKLGITEPVLSRARGRDRPRDGRRLSGAAAEPRRRSSGRFVSEEDRFDAVLTSGLPKLEELLDRTAASATKTVPGRRGLPAVRLARRAVGFRRGSRRPARA